MELVNDTDFLEFLGVQESQNITPAVEFKERVNAVRTNSGSMQGLKLPWNCLLYTSPSPRD